MQSKNDKPPYINVDYFEDLTGDIGKGQAEEVKDLGNKIRELREQKGFSLEHMVKVTGFDRETINSIEEGQLQPQLGTIIRLSKALEGALGSLISGEGEKSYTITRKDQRKSVARSISSSGQKELYAYKSLAPEVSGRHMEPLIVQLRENPEEETSVHEGEEFIFVLEGTVLLKLGEEEFELTSGDSVYYQSSLPHLVSAKQDTATILAVIYEGK